MSWNNLTFQTHFSPRTVLGIAIAAGTLVAITFGYSIWQWRSDWILAHQAIAAPAPIAAVSTESIMASIQNGHIFGKPPTAQLGNVPITNLQMQVTGIVKVDANQSGEVSKAYISIAGQPSKVYSVGDALPYGVKLYDVTADSVVLENNGGHLEKLPLPREHLQFKPRQREENQ